MKTQNYSNHRQFVPTFHFLTGTGMVLLLAGSVYYTFASCHASLLPGLLFILISLMIISLFFHSRLFALKAQDRAIRAEENFRHYILTGKPLDPQLSPGQIVALRFAGDEELAALAQRAVSEKLRPGEIKKQIRHWRPDHHRV